MAIVPPSKTQHLDPPPYPDLVVSADRPLEADLDGLAHRLSGQRVKLIGYCAKETLRNHYPLAHQWPESPRRPGR